MKKTPTKVNKIYQEIIFNTYTKKVGWLIIVLLLVFLLIKDCKPIKPVLTSPSITKELLQKQKSYKDSINILNKKLLVLSTKKDSVIVKYNVKKEYIKVYKERLITESIDTASLIIIYDEALTLCDSLNKTNDSIIYTQNYKIVFLDSINSTQAYRSYLMEKDIKTLNQSLNKQKRKTLASSIGYGLLGGAIGGASGYILGHFK